MPIKCWDLIGELVNFIKKYSCSDCNSIGKACTPMRNSNLYADDTLIYCTGGNIVELKTDIQKCVTDVHEWYVSNKLVINTYKSNVMLLSTRQMLSLMTDTDLNVCIGNYQLLQCNNIKYIGVDIDNVLSWDIQTDSISKKLVFIISRLSTLKPVLPSQMLMYIYEHYPTQNILCNIDMGLYDRT